MRLGRRKLPVLAEISARPPDGSRAWALQRRDMDAHQALLARLGGARLVLITGDAEGKGMAAIGLATTAAANGTRTALLECDLTNPTLAGFLGLEPAPGLHEYLREAASAAQILQSLVLAGPGSGGAGGPLVCVVGGEPTPHSGTLLATAGFAHAVERLRSAYDLIVAAGPPLGGEEVALARAAALADAVLVCVDRRATTGRPARRLERELRFLPSRCDGLIALT